MTVRASSTERVELMSWPTFRRDSSNPARWRADSYNQVLRMAGEASDASSSRRVCCSREKALSRSESTLITPRTSPPTRKGTANSELTPSRKGTYRRSFETSSMRSVRPDRATSPVMPSPKRSRNWLACPGRPLVASISRKPLVGLIRQIEPELLSIRRTTSSSRICSDSRRSRVEYTRCTVRWSDSKRERRAWRSRVESGSITGFMMLPDPRCENQADDAEYEIG